jgi:hypothetical protein
VFGIGTPVQAACKWFSVEMALLNIRLKVYSNQILTKVKYLRSHTFALSQEDDAIASAARCRGRRRQWRRKAVVLPTATCLENWTH